MPAFTEQLEAFRQAANELDQLAERLAETSESQTRLLREQADAMQKSHVAANRYFRIRQAIADRLEAEANKTPGTVPSPSLQLAVGTWHAINDASVARRTHVTERLAREDAEQVQIQRSMEAERLLWEVDRDARPSNHDSPNERDYR